ncbi:hypothetical protein L228DRAFT_280934 [Xylona heveae TC161]|uniref:Chorismate synthase protein n=1 Tax=Xylona heveae (strain CBS 132557 / TC161) TaxID=1328760 RepID=A0A165J4B8_XYLHT|nr:hypothetical protein L228DRAFT_280934 [Xylona heveae TC161]KZF25712.1 hypothetical protein L228DRAFT_280934 [Xylona heveae TC161]
MLSWATLKTLLFTLGPLFLPKLITYYRNLRAHSQSHNVPIRPVPSHVSIALNLLLISFTLALLSTFPYFAPANIFSLTGSRLQTPTDVLFSRLAALRPLTPSDEILKTKLINMDSRLLYLTHGPDTLVNCEFCNSEEPLTYLYYAIPALLAPHLLHIGLLGLVTSPLLSKSEGRIWRTSATIAGIGLAAAEVYLIINYDAKVANTGALRVGDIDAFYWRRKVYRGLGLAVLDALLGWGMYLSSTNRLFVTPPPPAMRIENSTKMLEAAQRKLQSLGMMRNVILRDAPLRSLMEKYWIAEDKVMTEIFEDREVVDGMNVALGRTNVDVIMDDAEKYATRIVSAVPGGEPDT